MISHVTIDPHDAVYDHDEEQAVMAVTVHHRNGRRDPARLVMQPGEVELYVIQLEQMIRNRAEARKRDGEAAGE